MLGPYGILGVHPEGTFAEEGLVGGEKILRCIPGLIYITCFGSTHLLGRYEIEITEETECTV